MTAPLLVVEFGVDPCPLIRLHDALCRDELCDHDIGTEFFADATENQIRHPCHGGEVEGECVVLEPRQHETGRKRKSHRYGHAPFEREARRLFAVEVIVGTKIVEPDSFGPSINRMFFPYLGAVGHPLTIPRSHRVELGEGGLSEGGVGCAVFECQVFHEVGTFQDDATAGVFCGGFTEILHEGRFCKRFINRSVADILGGELNDGAGFDCAGRGNVVRDPVGHGAEGFAFSVVVGVDDAERQLHTHIHDKFTDAAGLLRGEREILIRLWPNGAVGVIPGVVNATIDQLSQPRFGEEIVDIGAAEASSDPGE